MGSGTERRGRVGCNFCILLRAVLTCLILEDLIILLASWEIWYSGKEESQGAGSMGECCFSQTCDYLKTRGKGDKQSRNWNEMFGFVFLSLPLSFFFGPKYLMDLKENALVNFFFSVLWLLLQLFFHPLWKCFKIIFSKTLSSETLKQNFFALSWPKYFWFDKNKMIIISSSPPYVNNFK